jgi:thiosulfate/3-mercaptopyruvate sulfurtransferase
MYAALVTAEELLPHLDDPNWLVIDCRFSLQEPGKGREDYLEEHIPGSIYAHLDEDLSGPVMPGKTSRHPLPSLERMTALFSAWGIDERVQVVVLDFKGGGMAVRLWWMLQWLGHEAVALLDGGWGGWKEKGFPVTDEIVEPSPRNFVPRMQEGWTMDAYQVDAVRQDPRFRVVDSRSYDRYLGLQEPIDPVAGHIPGAICLDFMENLNEQGFFKSTEDLRRRFEQALQGIPADHVVFYCGSGVTSCHNIFAMQLAGLGMPRIYPGSWSEWITDPRRPVATGE